MSLCKTCTLNPGSAEFGENCMSCAFPKNVEWKKPLEQTWAYRCRGKPGCPCENEKSGYRKFQGEWIPCGICRPGARI